MDETKTTANQNEPATQPEDNGAQETRSDRTFTQEEVNRIVSERLAKERSRAAQAQQTEADNRAAELTAKENRLICKEFLIDNEYPAELLDAIDTSDPEEFKRKATSAYNAIHGKRQFAPSPQYNPELPPSAHSALSDAFGHDVKHTPQNSDYYY